MRALHHISLFTVLLLLATSLQASGFPLREMFPKVATIELEALYQQREGVIIVDVRSAYEYETLHIKGALNMSSDESGFISELQKLREHDKRPLVFYCNGHTCRKSYEAAQRASENGIADTLTYDAGIFDWARSYPDDAVLLGQSPVDPARLISREKLAQHMLEPEAFAQRVSNNSIVLDIRDNSQKDAINLFPMQQRSVALDNNRLAAFVRQAKQEDKTLLIYDAVGRQVAWLQYYLEAEQVPSYFFMRGGAEAFLKF